MKDPASHQSSKEPVLPTPRQLGAVPGTGRWAFGEAGLHRLQAGTLLHDAASQQVLRTSGCTPIGVAPRYLCISCRWQDHVLFQLLHEPGMR